MAVFWPDYAGRRYHPSIIHVACSVVGMNADKGPFFKETESEAEIEPAVSETPIESSFSLLRTILMRRTIGTYHQTPA